MEIDIDLNKRIEWIKQRVVLDSTTEQYIRFQMQEAVIEALSVVEKLSQHDVIESVCEHRNYRAGHSPFVPCICNDCGEEL